MPTSHIALSTRHKHDGCSCPVCGGLECLCRPRFFAGQLLTETDLQALDHYIIEKNKLHNRYLHGTGAVCGLEVLCHECKGWVTIKAGYAIDPCGNDLIVCKDYSFDLCAKIRECCDGKGKDWECDPIASPPPECKDLEQRWYVTLRYVETESRGITALRTPRAQPCCTTCGCGSTAGKGGCRCSCHANGHKQESSGCSTSGRRPPLQCEPTRVCEGFAVEVAPAPPPKREKPPLEMFEGTALARMDECAQAVTAVQSQKPILANLGNNAKSLQQACCLYKKAVWDFLKNHPFTRCEMLVRLAELQCPLPFTSPNGIVNTSALDKTIQALDKLLLEFQQQCVCLALLPPCPGLVTDPGVILACVTVRHDQNSCRIIDICHWHGRKFVWTWPNVFYWLPVGTLYKQVLENACCPAPAGHP